MILVPLISLALLTLYVVYQRSLSPLAKIPGPFLASISKLWITLLSYRGGTHRVIVDLHKKHGKVVRTGPNEVSIGDPSVLKQIYGAGTKFRKSSWYSVWQGRRKFDLFAERDETIHAAQRRLVARPYSLESVKDLEPYIDDAIKVFFKHMDEMRDHPIDLGNWIQLFAFDVIGEVTFSKRFGFMDQGSDDGSFLQIHDALRCAAWVGQVPWVYWLHEYLTPLIGNHLAVAARHGSLRNFAVREIASRKDRGSDHDDLVSKLSAIHEKNPKEFDEAGMTSMATSNIFAGSDTTAVSARAVVYYLLKNPEYKMRLIQEIDERHRGEKLSDPVKYDEANSMPYLQAVIYEALRIHPAVGMSLPRVVPEGGLMVEGHFIPAGTVVGANSWVIHQDKDIFGADADTFRPERWLVEDTSDMHRAFLTFGGGARICIGRNIAWMEISKLIPTLFLRYDVELAEPEVEWETSSLFFVVQKGVTVTLRPRRLV